MKPEDVAARVEVMESGVFDVYVPNGQGGEVTLGAVKRVRLDFAQGFRPEVVLVLDARHVDVHHNVARLSGPRPAGSDTIAAPPKPTSSASLPVDQAKGGSRARG